MKEIYHGSSKMTITQNIGVEEGPLIDYLVILLAFSIKAQFILTTEIEISLQGWYILCSVFEN